jgi:hypothetical protein
MTDPYLSSEKHPGVVVIRARLNGEELQLPGDREEYDPSHEETRFNAGETLLAESLAPGRHTLAVKTQHATGWTHWTEPFKFTITEPEPGPEIGIRSICNSTRGQCRSLFSAVATLNPDDGSDNLHIWVIGKDNQEDVRYRFDGGAALTEDQMKAAFERLTAGAHTIAAMEQRPDGPTEWSDPYEFVIGPHPSSPRERVTILAVSGLQGTDGQRASGVARRVLIRRSDGTAWYLTIAESEWLVRADGPLPERLCPPELLESPESDVYIEGHDGEYSEDRGWSLTVHQSGEAVAYCKASQEGDFHGPLEIEQNNDGAYVLSLT